MRRIHYKVKYGILSFIDFFYPIFRKFLPTQTYRYAVCGGVNTTISLVVFFVAHNFIFRNQPVHVGPLTISSYIAAYILGFCLSFPVGFYLSMFVVFEGSSLKRHHQLFRYFLVIIGCMILNYICLKIFVDIMGWYPTPSQVLTTVIIILFNYFSQRHFSFKGNKKPIVEPATVAVKALD